MTEPIPKGKQVGEITHFFGKIGVAVVKASDTIKAGDAIVISGHGQEFEQVVDSLEVEHKQVPEIKTGEEAGMKVAQPIKEGYTVYLKA